VNLWAQHERKIALYPHEPLAKRALRMSIADSSRRIITEDELCSFKFNIRLRGDGPLAPLLENDPWWKGKGCGEVQFQADHTVTFQWPDNMNPFSEMMGDASRLSWRLPSKACYVQLLMFGSRGPQEFILRHPNWGWMLVSGGTCWSSFPMPVRGTDSFMEDSNLVDMLDWILEDRDR